MPAQQKALAVSSHFSKLNSSVNRLFLNKFLIAALSVTCLLIFVVPHSLVFYIDDGSTNRNGWKSSYVFDDTVLTIIYSPFFVLWVTYLLLKNNIVKKILGVFLVCLAILYLIIALLSITMISQDVVPHVGVYISILVFPLLIGYLISSKSKMEEK